MKLTKLLMAVALAWYFVAQGGGAYTQIGPFASQRACEAYRAQIGADAGPCWNSAAK